MLEHEKNMHDEPIGGFLELELPRLAEFHPNAIRVNTGRNALEMVLAARNFKRLHIPTYSCDAILEPLEKLQIPFNYYAIDENFSPQLPESIPAEEAVLYIDYFGLNRNKAQKLAASGMSVIVDNSQSFFAPPINGIDTFYSPRKFFGVPDGGYLYTSATVPHIEVTDLSSERVAHLVKRIDLGPEAAYPDFQRSEAQLCRQDIRTMSWLTRRMLESIDYEAVSRIRRDNVEYLHQRLHNVNELPLDWNGTDVPLAYPLLVSHEMMRAKLIAQRIFVPTYWPNVLHTATKDSLEHRLASNLLPLPIDQRYNSGHMSRIIQVLAL